MAEGRETQDAAHVEADEQQQGNKRYVPWDGRRLTEAMEDAGIDNRQVASAVGIDTRTVANWISGVSEPKARHIGALAKVTGRTPSWFLELRKDAK